MTPLSNKTLEWRLKVKSFYNFLTKAKFKKWGQNVSRVKLFFIYSRNVEAEAVEAVKFLWKRKKWTQKH